MALRPLADRHRRLGGRGAYAAGPTRGPRRRSAPTPWRRSPSSAAPPTCRTTTGWPTGTVRTPQVAIETQATFGYVQNRVIRALTDGPPPIDAIVEELFPPEAMHDIHAFYGSDGSQEELDRRITRLMESVATMGADRDLDVVPTSRYTFTLNG